MSLGTEEFLQQYVNSRYRLQQRADSRYGLQKYKKVESETNYGDKYIACHLRNSMI